MDAKWYALVGTIVTICAVGVIRRGFRAHGEAYLRELFKRRYGYGKWNGGG